MALLYFVLRGKLQGPSILNPVRGVPQGSVLRLLLFYHGTTHWDGAAWGVGDNRGLSGDNALIVGNGQKTMPSWPRVNP